MPRQPLRARSHSQLRAAARRFVPFSGPAAAGPGFSSGAGLPTASSMRSANASWTEPSSAPRAAASATK
ncbi:hypothetical protein SBADM41S_10791 [Streptomyces badius]